MEIRFKKDIEELKREIVLKSVDLDENKELKVNIDDYHNIDKYININAIIQFIITKALDSFIICLKTLPVNAYITNTPVPPIIPIRIPIKNIDTHVVCIFGR